MNYFINILTTVFVVIGKKKKKQVDKVATSGSPSFYNKEL